MTNLRVGTFALALSLFAAGLMHLLLTGEHLAESTLLGVGFVAAAFAQIGLGILALRPRLAPYGTIVALNAVLIALFAIHATTGLPLPDTQTDAPDRGLFGPVETIDRLSILTKLFELVGITLALWLRHERAQDADVKGLQRAA